MTAPAVKVLYVEDNPANLKLVRKALAARPGIELVGAASAEEGLAIAAREPPAAILLDINLPGMNGFDAVRVLKNDPACRHVPVVAVSANAMPADVDRALAAGFDDYLTKPVNIERLYAVMDGLLGGATGAP